MDQGESGAIQGKEKRPFQHLGAVAIEKGAFGSPSTMVDYISIYMFKGLYPLYSKDYIFWYILKDYFNTFCFVLIWSLF